MSQIEELRRIIVGDNTEALSELKTRLESIDARTKDVAEVLAPAIDRGIRDNDDLVNALKAPVSEGLKQAIRTEPEEYAEILYPAIAPSIRLAISQAISSMMVTIDQSVQAATSISGLKMRIQSARTGIPTAELALRNSLLYKVEHIYLIDRDSGLLISECAASEGVGLDSDAVGAMFSAIQSFVQDSFSQNDQDRLTDFKVGEHNVWIVHGPRAMLACVILGSAPESLKSQLYDVLDGIRTKYSGQLASFDGDTSGFMDVDGHLQPLLQMRLKDDADAPKKRSLASSLVWFLLALAIIYALYQWFSDSRQLDTVNYYLGDTAGLVVTKSYWQDGKIIVEGLQDPDARLPVKALAAYGLTDDMLEFRTRPFRSLEGQMEIQRFTDQLSLPAGVELVQSQTGLTLRGTAPISWLLKSNSRLSQLMLDRRVNLTELFADQNSVRKVVNIKLAGQAPELRLSILERLNSAPWSELSLDHSVLNRLMD